MKSPLSTRVFGEPRFLNQSQISRFCRKVGKFDKRYRLNASTTEVTDYGLPWWKDVRLYVARDSCIPELSFFAALIYQDRLFRLDGTSPPIHNLNKELPPQITSDTALDYLRFFCLFVNGEEGPFYVFESMEDPLLPDGIEDEAIKKLVRPAELITESAEGYVCEAAVWYSNAIFFAHFVVQLDGRVEMKEDEPLLADLPHKIKLNLKLAPKTS
ncbi:MAG: hypothetical protein AAF212_06335 [Verrucomicrobiota bacterium]